MKFEPLLPPEFEDREAMRRKAVEMRLAGHTVSQIAEALCFKTGGATLWKWLRGVPPPEWTKRPTAEDDLREKAIILRKEGKSYRGDQRGAGGLEELLLPLAQGCAAHGGASEEAGGSPANQRPEAS